MATEPSEPSLREAINESIRGRRTSDLYAAGHEDWATQLVRICDDWDLESHTYRGTDADGDAWSVRLVGGRFARRER